VGNDLVAAGAQGLRDIGAVLVSGGIQLAFQRQAEALAQL
jgi:hypothetical protein